MTIFSCAATVLLLAVLWGAFYNSVAKRWTPKQDNFLTMYVEPLSYCAGSILTAWVLADIHGAHTLAIFWVALFVAMWAMLTVWRKWVADFKRKRWALFCAWATAFLLLVFVACVMGARVQYKSWHDCQVSTCKFDSPFQLNRGLPGMYAWTQADIQVFRTVAAAASAGNNEAVLIGNSLGLMMVASQTAALVKHKVVVLAPYVGETAIPGQVWVEGVQPLFKPHNISVVCVLGVNASTSAVSNKVELKLKVLGGTDATVRADTVLVGDFDQGCRKPSGDACRSAWRTTVLGISVSTMADAVYYAIRAWWLI